MGSDCDRPSSLTPFVGRYSSRSKIEAMEASVKGILSEEKVGCGSRLVGVCNSSGAR